MANLIQIASAWYKYIEASPITQQRMRKRLAVCDGCPNKEQVDRVTSFIVQTIKNDPKNLFRCKLCKCPLASLASLPSPACKANYWPE